MTYFTLLLRMIRILRMNEMSAKTEAKKTPAKAGGQPGKKTTPAKTAKVAKPKVVAPEKVAEVVKPEKKEVVSEPRTCKACGKPFESKFSGSLYCPECAVVKKRERRKAAQKRRKEHRRDELGDLRQLKIDIKEALEKKDALAQIKRLVEG